MTGKLYDFSGNFFANVKDIKFHPQKGNPPGRTFPGGETYPNTSGAVWISFLADNPPIETQVYKLVAENENPQFKE